MEKMCKNILWACLVINFKLIFSHFKQYYTYFYTFFHSYVFQKITNNIFETTLPNNSYITEKNMFKLLCQSSIEHNSPYSAKKKKIKNTTLLLQDLHPHTIIKRCMELLKGQSYPTPRDPILSRTLCTYKPFNTY